MNYFHAFEGDTRVMVSHKRVNGQWLLYDGKIPYDYRGRVELIRSLSKFYMVWVRPSTKGGKIRIYLGEEK